MSTKVKRSTRHDPRDPFPRDPRDKVLYQVAPNRVFIPGDDDGDGTKYTAGQEVLLSPERVASEKLNHLVKLIGNDAEAMEGPTAAVSSEARTRALEFRSRSKRHNSVVESLEKNPPEMKATFKRRPK